MSAPRPSWMLTFVPRFVLAHTHTARECGVVFAAFKGFESPLRHALTVGGCDFGDHLIWWDVEAATAQAALAQLPPYVAQRTTAIQVRHIRTP